MERLNDKETDLAGRLHALESVDAGAFQPRARLVQAIWRDEQGFEAGQSRGKRRGARLQMPFAKESLANYLTETIRKVVRAEVMDPVKRKGKLYGAPRIYDNLLSSQPLCFNLFAELQQDRALATVVFRELTAGRVTAVSAIEFEHSPGRGDPEYTGDNSAFDVFVEGTNSAGSAVFLGIEVKYHENLKVSAAEHKERYDELADQMACFKQEARGRLKQSPLEQVWRDHLLAGALLDKGRYDDGLFVFLYPRDNEFCAAGVRDYRECLEDARSFDAWTLEEVVDTIRHNAADAEWPKLFWSRYLDFGKIERACQTDDKGPG